MWGALPGARELRSALVGGYLWILALWLALDPIVGESNLDLEPYRSAHHLGEQVGPLALAATATFAAYLIGTFFNELRTVVARLYLRARQSAGSSTSAQIRAEVADTLKQQRETRRRLRNSKQETMGLSRPEGDEGDTSPTAKAREVVSRLTDILQETLGVVRPLPFSVFATAVSDVIEELALAAARPLIAIRIEPYKPFVSERGIASIERYLKRSVASQEIADSEVADVIADFPVVRTRLLHKSPDTVNEYDRLRTEAEFRSAIFLPLFALIVILVVKASWLWVFLLVPLSILLGTARAKRRDAGDILADVLGSVVQAPSVEAKTGRVDGSEHPSTPPPEISAAGSE